MARAMPEEDSFIWVEIAEPVARQDSSKFNRVDYDLGLEPGFKVIGSSEQVHVVDALAITGDEGRCSLR